MRDFSKYNHVDQAAEVDLYTASSDPDILIVVPRPGVVETAQLALENEAAMVKFAQAQGKMCGAIVIMANMLGQAPEARRVYANMDERLWYGTVLIVENPLSRALGSFFIGLSRPKIPPRLFNTMEDALLAWLRSVRTA